MNGMHGHLEILSRPQVIENSRQYFDSPNRHFTEKSRWVPQLGSRSQLQKVIAFD